MVVTHGTDTLITTARYLKAKLQQSRGGPIMPATAVHDAHIWAAAVRSARQKTIVITGAMHPQKFSDSDARLNVGGSMTAAQLLPPGVYVSMHGSVFEADGCKRDSGTGAFVPLERSGEAAESTDSPTAVSGESQGIWRAEDDRPAPTTQGTTAAAAPAGVAARPKVVVEDTSGHATGTKTAASAAAPMSSTSTASSTSRLPTSGGRAGGQSKAGPRRGPPAIGSTGPRAEPDRTVTED